MSAPGKPPHALRSRDSQTQAQHTQMNASMAAASFSPHLTASSLCQPAQPPQQVMTKHQAAWLRQKAESFASLVQPLPELCRAKGPRMPPCNRGTRSSCTAAAGPAAASIVDKTLMVKLSLAQSSGKLDLSECELNSVPEEVFALAELEVSTTRAGCPLQDQAPLDPPLMHRRSLLLTDDMISDSYRLLHMLATMTPSVSTGLMSMLQDV